jgi:hypothetical protein
VIFVHVLDRNISILIQRWTIVMWVQSQRLQSNIDHKLAPWPALLLPCLLEDGTQQCVHLAEVSFFIFLFLSSLVLSSYIISIYDIFPLVCIWGDTRIILLETVSRSSSVKVLLEGAVLMQGSNRGNLSWRDINHLAKRTSTKHCVTWIFCACCNFFVNIKTWLINWHS